MEASVSKIWKNFLITRSNRDRNALVEHYLPLAKFLAKKCKERLEYAHLEYEDVLGWANIGIIHAINTYDPLKGTKPSSWIYSRTLYAISHYKRDESGIRSIDYRLKQTINSFIRKYKIEFKEHPSTVLLCEKFELQEEELFRLLYSNFQVELIEDVAEAALHSRNFENNSDSQIEGIMAIELLASINPEKAKVIYEHIVNQKTFAEISREYNIKYYVVQKRFLSGIQELKNKVQELLEVEQGRKPKNGKKYKVSRYS